VKYTWSSVLPKLDCWSCCFSRPYAVQITFFQLKLLLRMRRSAWSPQPKRHLDRFSCFCRAYNCDRQTDRPRYSGC